MEHLFSRLFVPKTIHSHGGTFVIGNEWSIDNSFPRTNEPWTFRSLDHLFTATFVPSYKKVVKDSMILGFGILLPELRRNFDHPIPVT